MGGFISSLGAIFAPGSDAYVYIIKYGGTTYKILSLERFNLYIGRGHRYQKRHRPSKVGIILQIC